MKNLKKYFKFSLFFTIFIALILFTGVLITLFREDDIICFKLMNYLSEFYYKKVSLSKICHTIYMGDNYEINNIISEDRLYYLKGDEEEIKEKEIENKEGKGFRQIINLSSIQGEELITDQTIDSELRVTRVPQLPGTIGRNFDREGEELVQSRKECLINLKSLIRATNLTINTNISKEELQSLDKFKIIEVNDKKFYIKRNVFYNGDREKVRTLIEELRNFYNKGHEFTRIQ
jgi:hypothetical protein